jgi:hypothetical protein
MQATRLWAGLGLGVATMFLIDPGQRRRRRARVRDTAVRGIRRTFIETGRAPHDAAGRSQSAYS